MCAFKPFSGTPQSTNLENLTLESDEEKIVIMGDLEIRRDQSGLDKARRLKSMITAIVDSLESGSLPDLDRQPADDAVTDIANPFGDNS